MTCLCQFPVFTLRLFTTARVSIINMDIPFWIHIESLPCVCVLCATNRNKRSERSLPVCHRVVLRVICRSCGVYMKLSSDFIVVLYRTPLQMCTTHTNSFGSSFKITTVPRPGTATSVPADDDVAAASVTCDTGYVLVQMQRS